MSRTGIDNHKDDMEERFVEELLGSYFTFRKSMPEAGYIQENRTTQQIQDDLSSMYPLTTGDIVGYMVKHEYNYFSEPDGTVAWAIWRQV